MHISKERLRRPVMILLIVLGALVLGAILFGVLNATVGKGEWTPGWSGYRYDDSSYRSGNASIPQKEVRVLSLDWIDGNVEILACDDTYISITEKADSILTEDACVHWSMDENGTVSVKYRASSWILGAGKKNLNKNLTLRIPKKILEGIERIEIKTASANLTLKDLECPAALAITTDSGEVVLSGGSYATLAVTSTSGRVKLHADVKEVLAVTTEGGDVEWSCAIPAPSVAITSRGGDVRLAFSEDSSFALAFKTQKGRLSSELAMQEESAAVGEAWIYGTGECHISVTTHYGSLEIKKR